MRFSLREFMLLCTAACLAIPALCFANPLTKGIFVFVTGLILMRALMHAVFDRGKRRTAALGFAITAMLYATLLLFLNGSNNREMDPYKPEFGIRNWSLGV